MKSEPSIRPLARASVKGRRVLVRVDFNVPIVRGRVADDFRIVGALPTARWLFRHGAHPLFLTHLEPVRSVRPVFRHFEKLLGHRVEYLENLRYEPGEEGNDMIFAKKLAVFGDIFVNEAFSVSHRAHASIVSLPKLLPSYGGFAFMKELSVLTETLTPPHPFLFVLGGAKFATKVPVLDRFLKKSEAVFIGGALANTFLAARGYGIGSSSVEREAITHIRTRYAKNKKILLPIDLRVRRGRTSLIRPVDALYKNDMVVDVGPETIRMIAPLIDRARMVLWNGPLGMYERGFSESTEALIKVLGESRAKVIVGGGDTHVLVRRMHAEKTFYHLSTGGGALLEFLDDGEMVGLRALLHSPR